MGVGSGGVAAAASETVGFETVDAGRLILEDFATGI
jgi:hypothetical protein